MTVGPTLGGGLKIVPDNDKDWYVLVNIARDGEGNLAADLGELMDEDSMWEDIVVPELEGEFSRQRNMVVDAVMKARRTEGSEIVIEKEQAESWYGALNQARIQLEAKYQFGPGVFDVSKEGDDSERLSAGFRKEFYKGLQAMLMPLFMGS